MIKYITITNTANSNDEKYNITCMWENADAVEEYVQRTARIFPDNSIKVLDIKNKEWTVYIGGKIVEYNMGVVI